MLKLGRPKGLIAYDTDENLARRMRGEAPVLRVVRPRTILYAALIAGVGATMLHGLATRSFTGLSVLHDRNPIFVQLSDGSIRNGYTLRLLNKRPVDRVFTLAVDGLPDARVEVVGATGEGGRASVAVAPDSTHEVRALVFAPPGARLDKATPVTFRIVDLASAETAAADDHFKAP
jgi:polyferredoxin